MPLPVLEFEGNLTRAPELKFTKSGKSVVNIGVACNSRKQDANGAWVDGETTFINLTAFEGLAENIATKFTIGNKVGGRAVWKERSYEKDGVTHKVYEGTLLKLWEEVPRFVKDEDRAPQPAKAEQPDPWATQGVVAEDEAPPF